MLTQRDILRRFSGRAGVFVPSPLATMASRPIRLLRTIVIFDTGVTVSVAYDETLELSALITSGGATGAASIASTADPETTFSLGQGTGDREVSLPAVNADKLRVSRIGADGPRWSGVSIRAGS